MEASFFSKPLSQSECRHNKKSCHLPDKKGTHPMRMHDNNTTCNRSNQNARLPDTHSRSTNQYPAAPDTTKTTCYRSAAQWWKAFLVIAGKTFSTSVSVGLADHCGWRQQPIRGGAGGGWTAQRPVISRHDVWRELLLTGNSDAATTLATSAADNSPSNNRAEYHVSLQECR